MSRPSKFIVFCAFVALLLTLTVTPAAFAQGAACDQRYIVQKGDWLSTIAQKFLGDAKAYPTILKATNDAAKIDSTFATVTDPNKIEVGQKLCIPAVTTVPGLELAGIYTSVGPAADASALVETLALGGDSQVRYTLDYIGKATIDSKGTWKQISDTVSVDLYEQAGKVVSETLAFTVKDGNLVAVAPPNETFTKTSADVAFYSGLYTANRPSADGKETLNALALLPNGQVQLTLTSTSNPFILQTGTWTVGKNADTGTPSITVNLTKQGDQTISEKYVFQADQEILRGTEYNKDKWGTDLTFTKFHAPAEPETPASAGGQTAAITGSYTAQLPAADAVGRVVVLDLASNNTASLTTQFIGKGAPIVDKGTWAMDAGNIAVALESKSSGKQNLTFAFSDGKLVLQNSVDAGYGTEGLTLTRVPSGNSQQVEFGGVSFRLDPQLAKSAQGEITKAIPVTEGPVLGGAMPASVRFLFNGEKAPEFLSPNVMQVSVYKTEDWEKLDPMTAKTVQALKDLVKNKPVTFVQEIPVLPPFPATQVFHVQTKYLNFQNGTGAEFVTYYAQDVSPVLADRIFYTYQGLTNDGKYYVTVFFPVTTALLPTDPTAALGGASYDEWAKNYIAYLTQLVKDLNGLHPAAYTPNLTLLQELVKSIEVSDTTLQ